MKIQTKHFSYQREPHFEGLYALSFSFSKNWGMIGLDLGKHTSNLILWRPKGSWWNMTNKFIYGAPICDCGHCKPKNRW